MQYGKTLFVTALLLSFNTQAALYDRGSGLIYDDVLNVTWLQDANYAKTSGYDADGRMNWNAATTWAGNLVYHDSVRNVDWSDWRLPTVKPINGISFNPMNLPTGTSDVGYNITSPNSELAYMYHVNLGLKSYLSRTGLIQADWGIFGNGTSNGVTTLIDAQNNVGPIINLQPYLYWSGSEQNAGLSWDFNFRDGFQEYRSKSNQIYAWAVRDGDVAAVPLPGAIWLFGSSLIGLLGFKRRGNKA